jgi:TPR repeat protein
MIEYKDHLAQAYVHLQNGEFDSARPLLIELRKQGSTEASLYMGYLFLAGDKDESLAAECFREAATKGVRAAKFNLGYILLKKGDYDEAVAWLRDAASNGDVAAMYHLYRTYKLRICNHVTQPEAIRYIVDSAKAEFPHSMREMQKLELSGSFGELRRLKAMAYFPFYTAKTIMRYRNLNNNKRFKESGLQ